MCPKSVAARASEHQQLNQEDPADVVETQENVRNTFLSGQSRLKQYLQHKTI